VSNKLFLTRLIHGRQRPIPDLLPSLPHRGRIFSDAAREYQRIQSAQGRRESADPFLDLVAKQRELDARRAAINCQDEWTIRFHAGYRRLEAQDAAVVGQVNQFVAFGKACTPYKVGFVDLTRDGARAAYQKRYVVLLKKSQMVVG